MAGIEEKEVEVINYQLKENKEDFIASWQDRQKKIDEYIKEYDGDRKVRKLQVGHREKTESGGISREAVKLLIKYQTKIVRTPVTFMLGKEPDIRPDNTDDQDSIDIISNFFAIRSPSKLINFAESVMSTGAGCFIFNKELGFDGEDKVNMRFYNSRAGNYYPKYDEYGDLIAFFWSFSTPDKTKHLWIFEATVVHKFTGEKLDFVETLEHGFDVIPVVFHEQNEPEWFDVKEMIDRLEVIISKLAGSNDYFAFPILKLTGAVEKDAETGEEKSTIDASEDGKALMLGYAIKEGHVLQSNAEFLQRDTGVDSIKLETELLKEFIHNISQTPDFSFNSMKGIGALSGAAMELMLTDAINKAIWKQTEYRTVVERMLSVIGSGLRVSGLIKAEEKPQFDVKFNLSIPKDLKEEIMILMEANGGKPVISQERSIALNPLVEDAEAERLQIAKEKTESLGKSYEM